MRHLALLAIVYVLVGALVLPSSLFAADEPQPAAEATAPTVTAPATTTVPVPEPAPAPSAPAPTPVAPSAPAPAPAHAPAQPAAPAPAPVQKLDDADAQAAPKAQAAASASVTIKDFEFGPGTVTVNVGDSVSWTNQGPTAHSATATGGSFDTGVFAKGGTRTTTFNTAGTYAYICTPHPFMKGTVIVQAASNQGGDNSGAGSGTSGTDGSGTAAGTTSGTTATGPQLASTGMDVAALAILGALMCLLGVAVRRRSADEAPAPAVRNGW